MEKKPLVWYVGDLAQNLKKLRQNHAKTFSPMRALLTLQWKRNYFRRMSPAPLIAAMARGKPFCTYRTVRGELVQLVSNALVVPNASRRRCESRRLVGAVGIEPTTFGLKGRCSTTELRP